MSFRHVNQNVINGLDARVHNIDLVHTRKMAAIFEQVHLRHSLVWRFEMKSIHSSMLMVLTRRVYVSEWTLLSLYTCRRKHLRKGTELLRFPGLLLSIVSQPSRRWTILGSTLCDTQEPPAVVTTLCYSNSDGLNTSEISSLLWRTNEYNDDIRVTKQRWDVTSFVLLDSWDHFTADVACSLYNVLVFEVALQTFKDEVTTRKYPILSSSSSKYTSWWTITRAK